jgi:hypothetical protein
MIAEFAEIAEKEGFFGYVDHPNLLVLPFRLELIRRAT